MPTRRVASVHKIRRIVWESRSITNLNFRVADNVALDSARTIWETVSADGGHGTIDNLFILRGKDEAMKLIQDKIRRLRGWLDHVDGQIAHLESDVKKLEELLDSGGPHLPPSHETVRLDGPVAFIDIDQVGDHEVIEEHISDIQSRYSIASPGYPEPSNGYHSEEQHQMRERADQRALARSSRPFGPGFLDTSMYPGDGPGFDDEDEEDDADGASSDDEDDGEASPEDDGAGAPTEDGDRDRGA
uniref:Uncharacterized protein n=1 Tax=Oryza brachyantha TaxID=4533 RepID=J3M2M1_ORYBR